MNLIYQSALLKALGWSLVNSLWQMGILWLLYVCLTLNGRKFKPAQRHFLALLTVTGGFAWFIISFFITLYYGDSGYYGLGKSYNGSLPDLMFLSPLLSRLAPFLSVAYLVTLVILSLRFVYHLNRNNRLYHAGLQAAEPAMVAFLQQLVQKMGVNRKVSIWLSGQVDTPLTIGFWKPLILLPVAALNNLSISQVEAVIVHELEHIKRNDYLINLVIVFAEIILFFNPFVRILAVIVKKERENSCDDKVLIHGYDAFQYAQALLLLEKSRLREHDLSVAATGKGHQMLLNRVKRILSKEPVPSPVLKKMAGCFIFLLLASAIGWYGRRDNPAASFREHAGYYWIPGAQYPDQLVEYMTDNTGMREISPLISQEKIAGTNSETAVPEFVRTSKKIRQSDGKSMRLEAVVVESSAQCNAASQPLTRVVFAEEPSIAASFINAETAQHSFSIVVPGKPAIPPSINAPKASYPFVPSSSFVIAADEHQSAPDIPRNIPEPVASEINRIFMEIDALDWQQLENELPADLDIPEDVAKENMKKNILEGFIMKFSKNIYVSPKHIYTSPVKIRTKTRILKITHI